MVRRPAPPRYCPACGGPCPDAGAEVCGYCGGPVLPLGVPDPRTSERCGSCAAAVSASAKFCGHCGAKRVELAATPGAECPACAGDDRCVIMRQWNLLADDVRPGGYPVSGCTSCGGVWLTTETLHAMLDSVARAPVPSGVKRRAMPRGTMTSDVRYRRCAVCQGIMHRRNFARISGVIVDECRQHGAFFDAGELEDIVEFVRTGGLTLAERQRQERQRSQARSQAAATPTLGGPVHYETEPSLVGAFVRWAWNWLA